MGDVLTLTSRNGSIRLQVPVAAVADLLQRRAEGITQALCAYTAYRMVDRPHGGQERGGVADEQVVDAVIRVSARTDGFGVEWLPDRHEAPESMLSGYESYDLYVDYLDVPGCVLSADDLVLLLLP